MRSTRTESSIVSENTDQNAENPREIDLSQYKGHTRGPWRYYDDEEHDCWVFEGEDIEAQARVAFFAFTPCEGIAYLDDPDLNLMIDAPDLLAALIKEREEVKRLREQFKLAYDWVDTQFPDGGMADFAEYIGDDA